MTPPVFDISIYQGDSFGDTWVVRIPDLTSAGGPSDLRDATVTAQIRAKQDPASELYATFSVEVLDATERRVRPRLTAQQTAALKKSGFWDLQVRQGAWRLTVLRGKANLVKEVSA